ncbi:peptidase S9 [Gluconacetobacter liquefaciens]|uniref:Acyl-peptide hydrolase n=1 Tax=Gluconacetobacter liquefaciens TaxID=89584 RepID=A0A370GBC2_GLULI|nr:prolyl oligopeptidase family serine peptidase [Gluconacetobacter liquefaciens]MBB2184944.1 S9 family peptidase [Gluconacetobacter liquefaciens]RDI40369.1 dipeptidyl aminopeptidase/acylaminoacyl peptidase [Gluconacetobacter liquefaciens]GBQ98043.1 peptidase S9 prolyl oligopeptidase [Gluconacetobacter liquefaciens NRIC 0522]GEB37300.1 peptidase S9 [Gluconacetobacter liquefaciens]
MTVRSSLLAASALFAATILPAHAAPAEDATRLATLLAMPYANGLTGAAGAPRLAWVERRNGIRNILVSDGGAAPHRVTAYTQDDGTDLWGLTLSPDGRMLAFVEGGDPEYPDDAPPNAGNAPVPGKQTVRVVLPDGRIATAGEGHAPTFSPDGRQLAFAHGGALLVGRAGGVPRTVLTTPGTITALHWSPDGTRLAIEIDRGSHALIALWQDKPGNEAPVFLPAALAQDQMPAFSPDGRSIAFVRARTPLLTAERGKGHFWSIQAYDIATGTERTLWTAPEGAGSRFWAPEGMGLTWTGNGRLLFPWEGSGWLRLCALPVAASPPTPHCLTPDGAEIATYRLSADRTRLLYTANSGDLDHWRAWSQPLDDTPATPLTAEDEQVTDLTTAGQAIAVMATGIAQPAHPVVLQNGARRTPVTATVPNGFTFAPPQIVHIHGADGYDIHGQLFLPPATTPGPHPALIFVHGGPERQMLPAFNAMGYYSNAYIMNQLLAARGYVVLSVNYRSGTGYGLAFRDAPGIGRAGASEYGDVHAAGLYLRARPDVAPARIGIWGGSWGGYLTALALARDSALFAAGADFHGVHDLTEPDHPGLSPEEKQRARASEWRSSPAADIAHWQAPVLLIHGDDDHNVAFEQSTLLARMLTARNVPFEDHIFPGERHAFLRTQDWLAAYLWTLHFLDAHLSAGHEK